MHLLISIGAGTGSLIIFGAIEIGAVVEGPVPSADGSSPALVQKVPVETGKRPVLCTFVLHEQGTLLSSELLQISRRRGKKKIITYCNAQTRMLSHTIRLLCIHNSHFFFLIWDLLIVLLNCLNVVSVLNS